MFELKLKLQKRLLQRKLRKNQEISASQVKESSPASVFASTALKIIVLSFFGAIILFPFFYMISISLMNDTEAALLKSEFRILPSFSSGSSFFAGKGEGGTKGATEIVDFSQVVANTYSRAASSGYWSAILLTSLNVVISVTLKVFVTFLMGYAFSLRNWRGKGLIWFIALALLVLPEVALLSGQYGVIIKTKLYKTYFGFLLAIAFPFTASIFNTVMYKNAFEAIPGRIKEVSLVDGAGGAKYLFKIAFPMVMPTTLTIIILTSLASWNSYLWPALISTINSTNNEVISVWLFKAGIDKNDPDSAINTFQNVKLAASILAIIPVFIFYLIFRKRIMGAISRQGSAIKG
ncbi:carbohydrate ABC transporter permease [Mycoplasma sp. Pen4]|uniref:carbohydrate ABC transporter permease n=1 Tax=Mycoplasma sp. Pen4 TaxID=640330 RepID=UPI0016547A3F|nr:carbohydrate ABC transporter permease [Mycoplasma sp. Pen4]QNM93577.1 carbohydrate ABC transporter permease [Mycoplasma sp. Pen4]